MVNHCQDQHPWDKVSQRAPLIWCIAEGYDSPGSPDYAVSIAYCESGSDLQDAYGGDGYVGTFQHITSQWDDRWEAFGKSLGVKSSPTNVLSQAVVSVRMAKSNGTWSSQWSCA